MNEEQRAHDKIACLALHERYRKQDLTHGLEAGRRQKPDSGDDGDEEELEEGTSEETEEQATMKRKRRSKEGSVIDSAEYAEYKSRMEERVNIRDQERKERREREMQLHEEAMAYNQRTEERQLKALEIADQTLKVASANLEVTQKLLGNSSLHSNALARLLER